MHVHACLHAQAHKGIYMHVYTASICTWNRMHSWSIHDAEQKQCVFVGAEIRHMYIYNHIHVHIHKHNASWRRLSSRQMKEAKHIYRW
jgi:hypothetical protein